LGTTSCQRHRPLLMSGAAEALGLQLAGRWAPEPLRQALLRRAVGAGSTEAVRSLAPRGADTATTTGAARSPLLVETLRRRPLHKLNTLFRQVAGHAGPAPELVAPLCRGAAVAWLRAAERGTLEGRTFVLEEVCVQLRREPSLVGRDLARLLAVDPAEVMPRWHRWQSEMATALVGGSSGGTVSPQAAMAAASLPDERGRAPLHYAAAVGNAELLDWLLAHGASPAARDDFGRTPEHLAVLAAQPAALARLRAAAPGDGPQDLQGLTAAAVEAARVSSQLPSVASAAPGSMARPVRPVQPVAAKGWRPAEPAAAAKALQLREVLEKGDGGFGACSDGGPGVAMAAVNGWGGKARALLAEAILLQMPLLLQGAAARFPASSAWTREGLLRRFGAMPLRSTAWWPWAGQGFGDSGPMTLQAFVEQMMPAAAAPALDPAAPPPYAFETTQGQAAEALAADVPLFPPGAGARGGLSVRPPQLALGPAGAGAPAHAHNAALNALIFGAKRWLLVPPCRATWSLRPPLLEAGAEAPDGIEVEQHAGDVLYIPEFWGHSTVLLADSAAATYEFVPSSSLWS